MDFLAGLDIALGNCLASGQTPDNLLKLGLWLALFWFAAGQAKRV